ncbi:MAG: SDR family NAD(P)-dependent oxidoreductase, partial [Anaerolineaceae bacterium]|nr:SDR family NAD(P)-dependent oxidoreductase [Anaerolineaceae bacterium]
MKGKTCLVTGGSSGIGKATALALAKMGAKVIIINCNPARGKAALEDIRAKSRNDAVHLMPADLSSQTDIRRLVCEFKAEHNQLHVLVNVAGILSWKRRLSVDGLEMNLELNYLAYFLLTNLLLDMLKKSAPSRIVNVTSVAHRWGRINFDNRQSEKGYNMFT